MNIEKNIIKIEDCESEVVIRERENKVRFEFSISEADRKRAFEKKLEEYDIENSSEIGAEFYQSCVDKGINDCYVRVLPNFKIAEDKIKVYMLIWNGKTKVVNMNMMPIKIFDGEEVVFTGLINGMKIVKSGDVEVCEGFVDVPSEKNIHKNMIVKL